MKKNQIKKVALLGTKYTMTQDFYKEKLIDAGVEVLIPNEPEIGLLIHQDDTLLPVFDTTQIHAAKAAMLALKD